ncbi:MAG TPA: hypothetical protein VL463_36585 [Kofleriaceae bacterium]|nr:hypothetical protein [Kofleriaceae bacterium]
MRRALVLSALLAAGPARAESPARPPAKPVDLLIVVDTASDAKPLRDDLVARLPAFVTELGQAFPGDWSEPGIDLHVAVASAADGALLVAPADCAAAAGDAYIVYASGQYGGATQNFTGTLADAIACAIPRETSAADTPKPLASMRSLLDGDTHGFLRADASLAILVVTSRDDCSGGAGLDAFACAEAAWSCTPALDATPGDRACGLRLGGGLATIEDAITWARGLEVSSARIALGVYRAAPRTIQVAAGPSIDPACERAATPAWRLDAFAKAVPATWTGDACGTDGLAGFAFTIEAATYPIPTTPGMDAGISCDGGYYPGEDPPHGHDTIGCGGCASGGDAAGGLLLAALVLTRFSPSRRYRGSRARAAG